MKSRTKKRNLNALQKAWPRQDWDDGASNAGALENAQDRLDRLKLEISRNVLARFSWIEVKLHALDNLARWRSQGVWSLAYDEWQEILEWGDERELIECMTGASERSNRLRQSMPYVGMLG